MHPRTARAWTWRASALLASCLVALVITEREHLFRSGLTVERVEVVTTFNEREVLQPAVSAAEFREFEVALFNMYGWPRAAKPVAPSGSQATRLPLAAYRIQMAVYNDNVRDQYALLLASKDPSHAGCIMLHGVQPDCGARIKSVEFGAKTVVFEVVRGVERFAFRLPRKRTHDSRIVRLPGEAVPRLRARGPRQSIAYAPIERDAEAARSLKSVPWKDTRGNVIGFRVTGVRPGGWASEFGLSSGDVVLHAEETQTLTAATFNAKLRDGWRPETMTVERNTDGSPERVTLGS